MTLLGSCALAAALAVPTEEVTCARFPDADSVLVDGLDETRYEADGRYVTESRNVIRILTEKGRREESVITLDYNARYGRASIVSVARLAADGTEEPIDVSATTKDATDNSSTGANIYDPLDRRITCTVPGLKVGDTLCYRTRREAEKTRVKDQFADISVFEWTCPILRQEVRITGPVSRPLRSIAIRHPLGNVGATVTTNAVDGTILYCWTATNSPQCFPEPDMPPLYTEVEHLRVSTASDWREISRWYADLCEGRLAKTTPAMTNKVEELGRDLRRIYRFVSQEIRYMGLTMEDTSPGYAPHDVDITFDNRYGVCRDKAALLVALLRIAGFKAYPVLIHAGAKMDVEVPLPYFNHAITAVHAPGDPLANADGYILLDPTDESSRDLMPSYLSNRSYLVAREDGETLLTSPSPSAALNALRVTGEGTLEKDGTILLEGEILFGGINDNAYRGGLLRRKPDDRRKLFERLVRAAAPGAELLKLDLRPQNLQDTTQPLTARLVARFPEALVAGESQDELTLPFLSKAFGVVNWLLDGSTSLEKRKYTLSIPSTVMADETLKLTLGEATGRMLAASADEPIAGGYDHALGWSVTNGVLAAHRRVAVNAVEFSPAGYLDLREDLKRVEARERRRPTFAHDRLANANVRCLSARETWRVRDARNWVVTNEVEKQILTYDGKRASSELKFSFNPTWKNVAVVSATVSNADGRVSAVTDRERNVLDCDWASAAPRYPATRELVVSLPSVEIGSVIRYTTVTTVSNAPAPFCRTWYFDSVNPTESAHVSVRAPFAENGGFDFDSEGPLPRVADEPMSAPGVLWRSCRTLSAGDWADAAVRLVPATEVAPVEPSSVEIEGPVTVEAIRNWMARHVRIAGPSLYEVPLAAQLTAPAVVLKERYGTRLDYVRTLCALLRGAGFEADVVFATLDADDPPAIRRRDLVEHPDVAAFSSALCRVTERKGGFLWWGGERTVRYLGVENEYAPLGATPYARSHVMDPRSVGSADDLGVVTQPSDDLDDRTERRMTISVRENGAADFEVEELTWGTGVGGFRKRYAEMLPEDRGRHHQELLGALAQAASATGELETDVASYPARRSFKAYVPDFASRSGDTLTVTVPEFASPLFPLTGPSRKNPLGVGAVEPSRVVVTVRFPEGYDCGEHLPEAYELANPADAGDVWQTFGVTRKTDGGALEVTLDRRRRAHADKVFGREYFALLKDWSRLASSRANRTVSARRRAHRNSASPAGGR